MPLDYEQVFAVIRRLVNAGPLPSLPKKKGDHTVLLSLACALFEPGRVYREDDVNDRLQEWLARFTSPITMDHVSFRRELVDDQFLLRDAAGTAYRVNVVKLDAQISAAARAIDPGAVMTEVRIRREERKRARST